MIRKYQKNDSILMMELIRSEGDEWSSYVEGDGIKYLNSLEKSITYVYMKEDRIIGYIRAIDDHGFDIYICDLLVNQNSRGHHYGRELIETIKKEYPNRDICVMSDVDPYYTKEGYKKIGSVFEIE